MNANADDAVDTSGIDISHHARLRVMQRLGVVERVSEHVRELLSKAELADPEFVTDATVYKIGGVYLILDPAGETVQTVLNREVRE